MRYNDILLDDDLDDLKTKVKVAVDRVQQPELLNKVYSHLRKTTLGGMTQIAFQKDEDAKKYLKRLSIILLDMEEPAEQKARFLREFGRKSFIKERSLFRPDGKLKGMDTWFNGDAFARKFFLQLFSDSALLARPKGPGEVAVAALSPKVTLKQDGDLGYGNLEVEVKAQSLTSRGSGEWTNKGAATAPVTDAFKKNKLDTTNVPTKIVSGGGQRQAAKSVNVTQVIQATKLPLGSQKKVFLDVLQGAYPEADPGILKATASKYPNHTIEDYAKCSFDAYKKSQGFNTMLLLNATDNDVQSMCFSDLDQVQGGKYGTFYMQGGQTGPHARLNL